MRPWFGFAEIWARAFLFSVLYFRSFLQFSFSFSRFLPLRPVPMFQFFFFRISLLSLAAGPDLERGEVPAAVLQQHGVVEMIDDGQI